MTLGQGTLRRLHPHRLRSANIVFGRGKKTRKSNPEPRIITVVVKRRASRAWLASGGLAASCSGRWTPLTLALPPQPRPVIVHLLVTAVGSGQWAAGQATPACAQVTRAEVSTTVSQGVELSGDDHQCHEWA
ncbi:hypothetical protein ElyMa_005712800 [Elysia marginata]|uniref:Uncharacterized protein n=1 Tax=Elysia marginata TaxID=1093978 RepID=A0AAV4FHG1_9GAST|nr:hypothetical protein ElyMa_005712800 [Elysia marginata]